MCVHVQLEWLLRELSARVGHLTQLRTSRTLSIRFVKVLLIRRVIVCGGAWTRLLPPALLVIVPLDAATYKIGFVRAALPYPLLSHKCLDHQLCLKNNTITTSPLHPPHPNVLPTNSWGYREQRTIIDAAITSIVYEFSKTEPSQYVYSILYYSIFTTALIQLHCREIDPVAHVKWIALSEAQQLDIIKQSQAAATRSLK